MLTQVYEISTSEEASAISAIGVDHIGVLVGDGRFPREMPIAAAAEVGAAIAPPSKFSALFLAPDIPLIVTWVRKLNPSIVHLGASAELLSPNDVCMLKQMLPGIVVMRSIPVFGDESVSIARSYADVADFCSSTPTDTMATRRSTCAAQRCRASLEMCTEFSTRANHTSGAAPVAATIRPTTSHLV